MRTSQTVPTSKVKHAVQAAKGTLWQGILLYHLVTGQFRMQIDVRSDDLRAPEARSDLCQRVAKLDWQRKKQTELDWVVTLGEQNHVLSPQVTASPQKFRTKCRARPLWWPWDVSLTRELLANGPASKDDLKELRKSIHRYCIYTNILGAL